MSNYPGIDPLDYEDLQSEVERLQELIREVIHSGVEHVSPEHYYALQIDTDLWRQLILASKGKY